MFSNIDGSLKAFSDEVKKFHTELTSQSDRMTDRVLASRVERSSLNTDAVQSEIDVLNYKNEMLLAFAAQAKDIRSQLNSAVATFEDEALLAAAPVEEPASEGWLQRLLGKQKNVVVHNEPDMNDSLTESFHASTNERLVKLDTLVAEIEYITAISNQALAKWTFQFKERVVDLSKQDPHRHLIEISLCESLVSNLAYHAKLYATPFKLASLEDVLPGPEPELVHLEQDIGAALSESLEEAFAL